MPLSFFIGQLHTNTHTHTHTLTRKEKSFNIQLHKTCTLALETCTNRHIHESCCQKVFLNSNFASMTHTHSHTQSLNRKLNSNKMLIVFVLLLMYCAREKGREKNFTIYAFVVVHLWVSMHKQQQQKHIENFMSFREVFLVRLSPSRLRCRSRFLWLRNHKSFHQLRVWE